MAKHMKQRVPEAPLPARITGGIEGALTVLAAVPVGILAIAALLITGYFVFMKPEGVGYDYLELLFPWDTGMFVSFLIPLVLLAGIVTVLLLAWRVLRRLPPRAVAVCALALIGVACVAWILILGTERNIYPDSVRLDQYARALLAGDTEAFTRDLGDGGISYLRVYPFQAGSVWLLAGVYMLFGVGNQIAFQLINAAFTVLAAGCIIWMAGRIFRDAAVANLASVLLVLFFPLVFSVSLVYGNAIGFGLCCASLACHVAAMQAPDLPRRRWALFAAGSVLMAGSLVVKSTFVIMLIAQVLAWVLVLVRERRPLPILVVLAAALAVNVAAGLPVRLLELAVGTDFGDGMPKTSWIAMGLTWPGELTQPGWWAPQQALHFAEVDGDAQAQGAYAMEAIRTAIAGFIADPGYALQFFATKIGTEWLDPTFQSLYYAATSVPEGSTGLASQVIYNGYTLNRGLIMFMDVVQTLLYASAFMGLVLSVRQRRSLRAGAVLLVLAFLGGGACYLLWEAKSVYTMPFALMLVPHAAYGLRCLLRAATDRGGAEAAPAGSHARR